LYRPLSALAPAVFPYLKKQEWQEYIPGDRRKQAGKDEGKSV
jgi:hypothetical protein